MSPQFNKKNAERGYCDRSKRDSSIAWRGMTGLGGSVEMIAKVHWEIAKRTIAKITREQNISCCCTSMIVSPFVLNRNVPLIGPPKGGQIGADRDEQEGIRKSGSASRCAQQTAGGSGRGAIDACELPASEAAVEAVSGGRCGRSETPQCRASIESRTPTKVSGQGAAGAAGGARKVRWASRRAVRADVG